LTTQNRKVMDISRNINEIMALKQAVDKAKKSDNDLAQWAATYVGLVDLMANVLIEVLEELEVVRKYQRKTYFV
jgi:uncharacterized protein with PhoU and TrkA domain